MFLVYDADFVSSSLIQENPVNLRGFGVARNLLLLALFQSAKAQSWPVHLANAVVLHSVPSTTNLTFSCYTRK